MQGVEGEGDDCGVATNAAVRRCPKTRHDCEGVTKNPTRPLIAVKARPTIPMSRRVVAGSEWATLLTPPARYFFHFLALIFSVSRVHLAAPPICRPSPRCGIFSDFPHYPLDLATWIREKGMDPFSPRSNFFRRDLLSSLLARSISFLFAGGFVCHSRIG